MKEITLQEIEAQLSNSDIDFEIIDHSKPIKSRDDALRYFKLEEVAPTLIVETETEMYSVE